MRYRLRTLLIAFGRSVIGLLFFVPFLLLLAIHDALGLSDDLGGLDHPVAAFNWLLVAAMSTGILGCFLHAVIATIHGDSWRLLVARLLVLAAFWAAVITLR
jgi:hypothetical protein